MIKSGQCAFACLIELFCRCFRKRGVLLSFRCCTTAFRRRFRRKVYGLTFTKPFSKDCASVLPLPHNGVSQAIHAECVQIDLHCSARAVVEIDLRSISPQRLFASRQKRRSLTPVYWGARTGLGGRIGSVLPVFVQYTGGQGSDAEGSVRRERSWGTCLRRPKGLNPFGIPTSLTRVGAVRGGAD